MYRMDYHLHTRHSMDCEMTLDTLCEAAIAAGLDEICVTDHTDFGHPHIPERFAPVISEWLADVERAQRAYPRLLIRVGLEIGDNPLIRDEIRAFHRALPLDFRLLSLHLVDNDDPYFQECFKTQGQDAFYRRYVEAVLDSALCWPAEEYDAIAHLGYCAKFAPYPVETRALRWRHAPDLFDALFRVMAREGKALEINVSGRKTMGECIPDRELLARFRAVGGEFVTLGSDAHYAAYVGRWLDDAREMAKEIGFRYVLTFDRAEPIPVAL